MKTSRNIWKWILVSNVQINQVLLCVNGFGIHTQTRPFDVILKIRIDWFLRLTPYWIEDINWVYQCAIPYKTISWKTQTYSSFDVMIWISCYEWSWFTFAQTSASIWRHLQMNQRCESAVLRNIKLAVMTSSIGFLNNLRVLICHKWFFESTTFTLTRIMNTLSGTQITPICRYFRCFR